MFKESKIFKAYKGKGYKTMISLVDKRDRELLKAYEAGISVVKLAKKNEICRQRIYWLLKRARQIRAMLG